VTALSPEQLLADLDQLGCTVWREGHRLKFRAPSSIASKVKLQLAANRVPLLVHLGASRGEVLRVEVERDMELHGINSELTAATQLLFDELGEPATLSFTTRRGAHRQWI
jgi:hypothetical protein